MTETLPFADLHLHTTYSDGFLRPCEVLHYAEMYGFKAVAITDHDTVSGVEEFLEEAKRLNIEAISGIELSAVVEGEEIHILGYFVDWKDSRFLDELGRIKSAREERIRRMLKHLEKLGVTINFADIMELAGEGTVSRLHLAYFLYTKGIVSSVYEAFDKYIGNGKPAYENIDALTAKGAIELIIQCGGTPVYAHPLLNKMDDIIPLLMEYGLKGIEVYHPSQSVDDSERYKILAKEKGLLITGGSDCHGKGKVNILIGKVKLPYHYVETLKNINH